MYVFSGYYSNSYILLNYTNVDFYVSTIFFKVITIISNERKKPLVYALYIVAVIISST